MEVNMSEQVKKPVRIMETVLRDAHQSLIATRMPTEVMLPIADKMDQVGYEAVEMWGGATFDSCLRFLKEDPWERLRKLKEKFKKTPMQMLLRGQNLSVSSTALTTSETLRHPSRRQRKRAATHRSRCPIHWVTLTQKITG